MEMTNFYMAQIKMTGVRKWTNWLEMRLIFKLFIFEDAGPVSDW